MNEIFKKIDAAKHIEIVVESEKLFVASALYSYILMLHKKVSLVCKDEKIGYKFFCIPWFEKIKKSDTPSADLNIMLECSFFELYDYFKNNTIKINQKIATALYGGLLYESDGFLSENTNGTTFALASELIRFGADYTKCKQFIIEHQTLGQLRLKSFMLEQMLLVNDAKSALFVVNRKILQSTRTDINDAQKIMKEGFSLPYIESVILLNGDAEYEVIKIINKGK